MYRLINIPEFIELIFSNLSDKDKLSFVSCNKLINDNKFLLKLDSTYDYSKIKNRWRLGQVTKIHLDLALDPNLTLGQCFNQQIDNLPRTLTHLTSEN